MTTALVHNGAPPGAALAVASPRSSGLIRPVAPPSEVLAVQEETREMVAEILQPGRDFGVIPGTDKPTMLKPGAERTVLAFGCYYGDPEIFEKEIDHDRSVHWIKRKKVWTNAFKGDRSFTWQEEHGDSLGLYRYVLRVPIISRDSGAVVGYGIGSCSTMESKYIDRPRDAENTALKMAHKRAIVSGCLITFGLSDQFTQDVEDHPRDQEAGGETEGNGGGAATTEPEAKCPKCGGRMWDNRTSKTNLKAPDYKCRDKQCEGAFWPGQWPPAALATPEQQAKITQLLAAADLADKEKAKLEKRAASTTKPLTVERADEMIAYLTALLPPVGMFEEEEGADAAAAGSGGPVSMPAGGKIEDALTPNAKVAPSPGATAAPPASTMSLTDLSREIGTLLKDQKLSADERAQYRAKLEAATTVEQLQALNTELMTFLDLPF